MALLYYRPEVLRKDSVRAAIRGTTIHGMSEFLGLFRAIKRNVSLIDRTGTITLPVKVKSLFPIPPFRQVSVSFEDLCNARACELLRATEEQQVKLYLLWSGGVDSTLALVSFLKNGTAEQLKRVVVLLSEESIAEYPEFFDNHIRGKLAVDVAMGFPYLLGRKALFVSGEHNDQLFGSDFAAQLIAAYGPTIIHKAYDRGVFREFWFREDLNPKWIDTFLELLERVSRCAPFEICSNYEFLWWMNFAMKWQSVYLRTLAYASAQNRSLIDENYVSRYYQPFFCTEAFQIWSMANRDKKIRNEWRTYKWVCKDIIYEFTRDSRYRDHKVKRGSLYFLLLRGVGVNFIGEKLTFFESLGVSDYSVVPNDFA